MPISRGAQDLLEAEGYLDANPDQRTATTSLLTRRPLLRRGDCDSAILSKSGTSSKRSSRNILRGTKDSQARAGRRSEAVQPTARSLPHSTSN